MLDFHRPRDIGLGVVLFSVLGALCAGTMVMLYAVGASVTSSWVGGYTFAAILPSMIVALLLYQRFEVQELRRVMEMKNRQS